MTAKTALVLLHEGVEEMEFVAPVDILRRGGVDVTVASAASRLSVTGRNGIQIKADLLLTDALYAPQAKWDLLVIPGGPGVAALRTNPLAQEAVKRHAGRIIGAICAAPLVLLDAGLISADGNPVSAQTAAGNPVCTQTASGVPYTAHPATAAELPAADAQQAVVTATVVRDGLQTKLITSRGAGTATVFALALLEAVTGGGQGRKIAAEVADSICLMAGQ